MQVTVAALTESEATLTDEKGQTAMHIPLEYLPEGIRLNDCLELAFLPDLSRLEEVKVEIDHLLTGLAGEGFKSMRQAKEQAMRAQVLSALTELVRIDGDRYYLRNLSHAAEAITKAVVGGR